jgi:hypothetical protein
MLACAVTVFGLLVGLGSWLVEATPPGWLPHRGAWIALCLGAALLAVPVWWRALGDAPAGQPGRA